MTNQQILTKAIKKATNNGWKFREGYVFLDDWKTPAPLKSVQFLETATGEVWHIPYQGIIFNHDFAKALWGDAEHGQSQLENWQEHLQQMVIAEDPISYLGSHLND